MSPMSTCWKLRESSGAVSEDVGKPCTKITVPEGSELTNPKVDDDIERLEANWLDASGELQWEGHPNQSHRLRDGLGVSDTEESTSSLEPLLPSGGEEGGCYTADEGEQAPSYAKVDEHLEAGFIPEEWSKMVILPELKVQACVHWG